MYITHHLRMNARCDRIGFGFEDVCASLLPRVSTTRITVAPLFGIVEMVYVVRNRTIKEAFSVAQHKPTAIPDDDPNHVLSTKHKHKESRSVLGKTRVPDDDSCHFFATYPASPELLMMMSDPCVANVFYADSSID